MSVLHYHNRSDCGSVASPSRLNGLQTCATDDSLNRSKQGPAVLSGCAANRGRVRNSAKGDNSIIASCACGMRNPWRHAGFDGFQTTPKRVFGGTCVAQFQRLTSCSVSFHGDNTGSNPHEQTSVKIRHCLPTQHRTSWRGGLRPLVPGWL